MTVKDMLKELRSYCAMRGCTFKECFHTVNGSPVYKVVDRQSYTYICGDFNINMAYENMCSGYIDDEIRDISIIYR
jgi:hypothetical protein